MSEDHEYIISRAPELSEDEAAAVRFVVDRILVQGRASYTPWLAAGDRRNMDKEIADECADAIVYTGMRAVMRAQRRARSVAKFIAADTNGHPYRDTPAGAYVPVVNNTDEECHCGAPPTCTHRHGCEWATVVR